MFLLVLLALASAVGCTNAQNCESKETCDECIQEVECAWCNYPSTVPGSPSSPCRLKNTSDNWCKDRISPSASYNVLRDRSFSSDNEHPVQIKPQRVKLSLRKGEKYEFEFQYRSTENYPVDLYYITDLSNSMNKFTQKLGQLGKRLADTMRNLTSNFKLGYGSFIDKSALPYAVMKNFRLKEPCRGCVVSYSFKNHLSLSSDHDAFVRAVKSSKFSGNPDTPEGGFDALMQAIVCKDNIGWRDKARHLIVFSTDGEYHTAGDGKLAGIVEPNPGTCYKDESDYLVYDYPSISQLNYVAKENNINIIFAILAEGRSDRSDLYSTLSKNIENSKFGVVDLQDSDVVKLIVDNYKKIEQTVKFISNSTKAVDVRFSSTCQSSLPDRCNNVHVGETLSFKATIQPRECLPKGQKTYILLKPEALNEGLMVELEVICECPCSSENHPDYVPKSSKCSGIGDLQCGVCACPEGRFGRQCECDSYIGSFSNITNCIMEGSSEICSGFGECKCGKCECSQNQNGRIYGQFCQCNNYSCRKEKGLLCSGKGTCNCNVCECEAGYSGEACGCQESTATCIMEDTDEICSGHGECKCAKCKCSEGYSGKYCEECITCPEGHKDRCSDYRLCVECKVYKTGYYKDHCEDKCEAFNVKIVEKLDENKDNGTDTCHVSDKESCMMHFDYYHENGIIYVKVVRECVQVDYFGWIVGVPLATMLLGLLSLISWKVLVSIHDKREYAKFENERRAVKWHNNQNPLYKEASSTFANPAYNTNRASRFEKS